MPSEEYWYGESRLTESYREAHELKMDMLNQQLWLQGLYNTEAFSVVIANAFAQKGTKKHKYLEKPIDLKPQQQSPEEAKQTVIDQLNAWKTQWDESHKEIQ